MSILKLSLLGTFEASVAGADAGHFPTDKGRALLAYLAMHADSPQRREALAELLWPERASEVALHSLRNELHRLRQTLESASPGLSAALITANRQTLALHRSALWLDVAAFESALAQVQNHSHRDPAQCEVCMRHLAHAVALYRGEFLAGLGLSDAPEFESWVLHQRERLARAIIAALDALSTAHEARDEHAAAATFAARAIALQPGHEPAHRSLMRALATQGRRAEAIAQFETAQRLLSEELGVEPEAETLHLYEQIRAGAFSIAPPSSPAPTAISIHHFPADSTPFIGRDTEITQLLDDILNPECRLVTIVGPGGIGKTRLAIQAVRILAARSGRTAHQFADGIYFVPLAPASSFEQALGALVEILEIHPTPDLSQAQQLRLALARKNILLVFDNIEQLLTAQIQTHLADWLSDLLAAAPRIKIITTSREAMNLRAERRIPLSGLSFPGDQDATADASDAVTLFIEAARRVQPGFTPDDHDQHAIVRVCRLVGGMPLALEIAASWIRLLPSPAIAAEIERSIDFLTAPVRDLPERHRSVRLVFEYSWNLLSVEEQTTLAQLAVFASDFSFASAQTITGAQAATLAALVDKSLLQRVENGRLRLHELIRQLAAEKLAALHPDDAVRHRHSRHFLRLLEPDAFTDAGIIAPDKRDAIDRDGDDVLQAWRFALAQHEWASLLRTATPLSHFLRMKGRFQEATQLFRSAAESLSRPAQIDPTDAEQLETVSLLRYLTGAALATQGEYRAARVHLLEAQTGWEALGNADWLSQTLAEIGAGDWRLGDIDSARTLLERSLRLGEQVGSLRRMAFALHHLGNLAYMEGDSEHAMQYLQRSLILAQQAGDTRQQIGILNDLGIHSWWYGHTDNIRRYLNSSIALSREIGDEQGTILPLANTIYIELAEQHYDAVGILLDQFSGVATKYGTPIDLAISRINEGHYALEQGDLYAAKACYSDALHHLMAIDRKNEFADVIVGWAGIAAAEGRYAEATHLLAFVTASGVRDHAPAPAYMVERRIIKNALAIAREQLDEAAFAAAWSAGEQSTLEQTAAALAAQLTTERVIR